VADGSVEIVKIEEAPVEPGDGFDGEKLQVVFMGSPTHARETGFWNGPPSDARLTEMDDGVPRMTVRAFTDGLIEKSTPVPLRFTEYESASTLSTMLRAPTAEPYAIGSKETFTVQVE